MGLRKTKAERSNPSNEILYKEMETLLKSYDHAQKIMDHINPANFGRLVSYRTQLLYFGYFTDKVSAKFKLKN